jgi:hypothetical protein
MTHKIRSLSRDSGGRLVSKETVGTVAFWEMVDRSGPDDSCWPWIGDVEPLGYGRFFVRGHGYRKAHRIALAFAEGPPPDATRRYALHKCRTPCCCNPRHLEWGSAKKNNGPDKRRDGTLRSSRLSNAVLNERLALEIRDQLHLKTNVVLAKEYGVGPSTISRIRHGLSWHWVSE